MSDSTRRAFLAMTGTGAAAVGALIATPTAFGSSRAGGSTYIPSPDGQAPPVEGPLVAYVDDARTGEISIMVGEREVTVVDKDLAARISRLTQPGA